MTSEEFLKEVLSSPLCPDNFEEIYKEFQKYQKITMDTLIEFHRVCEKSNIEYELAYGSLLGAIRDNGQIPWDYDIDVFVAFKDKERLIETLKKELDDKYYFYCPEVNQKCRHVIMRLAPKGYRSEALHVDVFYYVGTPNSVEERKLHIEQIKRTAHTRYCKLVNCKEEAGGNVKKYIRLMLDKMKYSMKKTEDLKNEYEKLCQMYPIDKSDYLVSADVFADWYEFPRILFEETELFHTVDGTFRIPKLYAELLTLVYKDYMSIPDLDTRIHEVMTHYNYLKFMENI
ncbi:LicD family protein [Mogibacterium sp.]|uniref:LicD family protein n=1 Tax=Mogibacterium sp. TaxID=2049035 RepID=UPI0025846FB4|nr:LicD family protein [Mogibacterium sp.]MCI7123100.1 LicD family protein [Mogibacterium sp.]